MPAVGLHLLRAFAKPLGKIVRVVSEPAVRGPQGSEEQPRHINRFFSNLVILVIAGGTLTAVALKKEFWPFSHFPMYSVTVDYRKPFTVYRLAGLITDFPIFEDERMFLMVFRKAAQSIRRTEFRGVPNVLQYACEMIFIH